MRRAARIPAAAYVIGGILPGALDWLNPWQGNDTNRTNEFEHFPEPPPMRDIYPHL